MNPRTESAPEGANQGAKKPRFALILATGFGLGYLPKAPGTFGSLVGAAIAWAFFRFLPADSPVDLYLHDVYLVVARLHIALLLALLVAIVGTWSAGRAAGYLGSTDPQVVVIDEVSGQLNTLLLSAGVSAASPTARFTSNLVQPFWHGGVNWKYFVLGFILFRAFDIWKPFPVRQAERLPGGWGIMADDWVASLYAALGLWVARAAGL